jgi:hypothetical protein
MRKLILLAAFTFLFALPARAGITQGVNATCEVSTANPIVCATTGTLTVGSFVRVWVSIGAVRTVSSMTFGTATGTFSVCEPPQANAANNTRLTAWCAVITGGATNDTITINLSANSGTSSIHVVEWLNSDGWNATMANNIESTTTVVNGTTETTIQTGTFNTTQARTLVVCDSHLSNTRVMTATEPAGLTPTLMFASGTALSHGVWASLSAAQTGIRCGGTIPTSATTWDITGGIYKGNPPASSSPRHRVIIQ